MQVEISDNNKILFLIFVSLGIYYPAIFGQVNSVDDFKMMQSLFSIDKIDWKGLFFPQSDLYYYRPLLYLTYITDHFLWFDEQSFWHLENIILHTLNGIIVFCISKEIINKFEIKRGNFVPMFISLLFILHPLNTEPTNWISGRTDLLAGTFVFASFLLFIKKGIRNHFFSVLASLLYFAGLLSKESAIGLMPVIFLFLIIKEKYIEDIEIKKRFLLFTPYLAVTIFYIGLRFFASGYNDVGTAMITKSKEALSLITMLLTSIKIFGFYIKKLFIPIPLNFAIVEIYKYTYISLGFILLIISMFMLKKRNIFSFFFLFTIPFFLIAIPVAIYKMAWTPYAERYLYISSFGVSAFIVLVINHFIREKIKYTLLILLVVVSGIITANRNLVWQNNLSLFEDTVRKSPNYSPARNEYGIALSKNGRNAEAEEQLRIADSLSGSSGYMLPKINEIEVKKVTKENITEAKEGYKKLLNSRTDIKLHSLKRLVTLTEFQLLNNKNSENTKTLITELISYFDEINEIEKNGYNYYRLGQLLLATGNKNMAVESFTKAAELEPDAYFAFAAKKLAKDIKNEINSK